MAQSETLPAVGQEQKPLAISFSQHKFTVAELAKSFGFGQKLPKVFETCAATTAYSS